MMQRLRSRLRREDGSMAIWFLGLVIILVLIAGIGIDFGRQAAAEQRATAAAREAARVACQNYTGQSVIAGHGVALDYAQASQAANTYLAASGVSGSVSLSGTQCRVDVRTTYRTEFLYLIGVTSLPVTATGTANTARTAGGAPR